MYPVYRDVKNWLIIDERTIYDYGDIATPFVAVNVLIGTLHREDTRIPITRWMLREEYNKYIER